MSGWWLDLSGNLVGTFIGALGALASGWWFRRRQQRRDETRLLQVLINALHWKRALSPSNVAGNPTGAQDDDDRKYCIESVLDVRRRIAETADRISISRHVLPSLDEMQRLCLAWLNLVEQRPDEYVTGLIRLRERFADLEREMGDRHSGLDVLEPGAGDVGASALLAGGSPRSHP